METNDFDISCKFFEDITILDIEQKPNFIVFKALRDEMSGQIPMEHVCKFLSILEIKATIEAIEREPEMFGRFVKAFCSAIVKMHKAFMDEFESVELFYSEIKGSEFTFKTD
jgi:hypothetical protein